MSNEDEDNSFVAAVDDLVKVLLCVTTGDKCRGSWQYSVPTVVNSGSATPPSVPQVSTYLLNENRITFSRGFMNSCVTMSILILFWRQFLERQMKDGVFWNK